MWTWKLLPNPLPSDAKLNVDDLDDLIRVADAIHPSLPESKDVFEERVKLFPEGCLALVKEGERSELVGYAISHPILFRQSPTLNSFLKQIDPGADQFYIHDVAVLPEFRRYGYAPQQCLNQLFLIAARLPTICLISVYGTVSFWSRFGFVPQKVDEGPEKKALGYGDDAIYLECESSKIQFSEDGLGSISRRHGRLRLD